MCRSAKLSFDCYEIVTSVRPMRERSIICYFYDRVCHADQRLRSGRYVGAFLQPEKAEFCQRHQYG